ncbi:alginate export family protein [Flavobacterium sp. J27]|uniref:alginate export family protein n=1 Tax=Flavobacterium sp. J27 TaxID=2060419 RepID=UPI001031C255|nr:alginate export family protein [Flavobacterium sp. J27]
MKKSIVFLLIFLNSALFAQSKVEFNFLRYNDKIFLDSLDNSLYYKLKWIKLSNNNSIHLSFGGENRIQYQYFNNENWDETLKDNNGFLLNRTLFHTNLKFGKTFRLFNEIQSSTSISRKNPNPLEENPLEMHQLFLDVSFNRFLLRIGRQELLYGSQRLISVREGPNSRQSFDALKLNYTKNNFSVDLIYGSQVQNKFGNFNDKLRTEIKLFGNYIIFKEVKFLDNIELYFFNLEKNKSEYNGVIGKENRSSLGTRIYGKYALWNYNFESLYQFGKIDNNKIKAWTISLDNNLSYSIVNLKQKLGFKTEYISGDRATSNVIETFNPLFPKGAYFGLAALIGPSNLIDIHPYLETQINNKMNINVDYDVFWRASIFDGIYQPNTSVLFQKSDSNSKMIGSQLGVQFEYNISNFLNFTIEGTWFNSEDFIKSVSNGKDIFFTASTVTLKF